MWMPWRGWPVRFGLVAVLATVGTLGLMGLWTARWASSSSGLVAAASICTPAELQTALTSAQPGTPLTIVLDDSSSCTFDLSESLSIGAGVDVTIEGNGQTLNGGDKAFDLIAVHDTGTNPTTLTLNDITLKNGLSGVYQEGNGSITMNRSASMGNAQSGIYTDFASVTATDSTISDNAYNGIRAGGDITLTRSTVSNNVTSKDSSANGLSTETGDLTIIDSTINGNGNIGVVSYGGQVTKVLRSTIDQNDWSGIQANEGTLTIDDSDVSGNGNHGVQAGQVVGMHGNVTVTGSTINNNGVDGVDGIPKVVVKSSIVSGNGRINVFGYDVTVIDSTISGANRSDYGGIYVYDGATVKNSTVVNNTNGILVVNGTATVTSSTISGNSKTGIYGYAGRPEQPSPPYTGKFTISTSILADNGQDCTGPITDQGYNLSTDASCGMIPQSNGPFNLQLLADNGGTTAGLPSAPQTIPTVALGPGSIAIDAIPVDRQGQCVAGTAVDERGITRPQGTGCDVGAFEAEGPRVLPGSTTTVHRGYWAVLRIAATSSTGENISARSLSVKSIELIGPEGQVISFAHRLQFGRFGGTPGYQMQINTRNLTPGKWQLEVRVGNDPQLYPVSFTVVR